jgi:hypothetical protein
LDVQTSTDVLLPWTDVKMGEEQKEERKKDRKKERCKPLQFHPTDTVALQKWRSLFRE